MNRGRGQGWAARLGDLVIENTIARNAKIAMIESENLPRRHGGTEKIGKAEPFLATDEHR
jgi:hypothetical protein